MDIYSPKKRSQIMSRVRGKNTSPELLVFRHLRQSGIYFQKHYDRIKGKPDIAIPSKKIAIFIDGNFWHGWAFEKRKAKLPPYWRSKIATNMRRDKKNRAAMRRDGWRILRVWEHGLSTKASRERYLKKISDFITYASVDSASNGSITRCR